MGLFATGLLGTHVGLFGTQKKTLTIHKIKPELMLATYAICRPTLGISVIYFSLKYYFGVFEHFCPIENCL